MLLWSSLFVAAVWAQEPVKLTLSIRYLTREALYLTAGTADGLRIGDKVQVMRNGRIVAQLEVKFVAEHSASCLLEGVSEEIRNDDKAVWAISREEFLKRTQPEVGPAEVAPATPQTRKSASMPSPRPTKSSRRTIRTRPVSGQVSLQAVLQRDNSSSRYDYFEPSAYIRLRGDRIAGAPLQFGLRLRTRQSYRTNPVNSRLEQRDTINRLYELSIEYAPGDGDVEISAGRILRNEIRGLGYLDGLAGSYRLGAEIRAGLFLGSQPELYRSSFQFDEKKLGGFFNYKHILRGNGEFSTTLAVIGRYRQSQVSREFLVLQGDLSLSRKLYVSQYVEMDVNRQWRRDAEGSALSFTDFFLNGTYYVQPSLSFNISYDARKLVRTWETHSLADSLFDDALRRGLHVGVQLRPMQSLNISINAGMRTSSNNENVYSGGLAVTQSNFLSSGLGISGRLSYYGNSLSKGYYPGADVTWRLFNRLHGSIGAGAYIYDMPASNRTNLWERLRLDFNFTSRLFCSGTFENFHGDSMKFIRAFFDMGVRF
jgi:hypothetical protein